jgi:hypothetical protein
MLWSNLAICVSIFIVDTPKQKANGSPLENDAISYQYPCFISTQPASSSHPHVVYHPQEYQDQHLSLLTANSLCCFYFSKWKAWVLGALAPIYSASIQQTIERQSNTANIIKFK